MRLPEDTQVGMFIAACKSRLAPFSDPRGLEPQQGFTPDKNGIETLFRKSGGSAVKFRFVTRDGFMVEVTFDLNKVNEKYLDNKTLEVRGAIQKFRREKHEQSSPIILPGTAF